jgi:hypothetical protein
LYIRDPGVVCQAFAALTLWFLGYPEQAVHTAWSRGPHPRPGTGRPL